MYTRKQKKLCVVENFYIIVIYIWSAISVVTSDYATANHSGTDSCKHNKQTLHFTTLCAVYAASNFPLYLLSPD